MSGATPGGGAVGYWSLFALVVLGSLVPVVPTGALVSGAAVVAFRSAGPVQPVLVFGTAAVAALVGDVALYWLGRRGSHTEGGSRWLRRLRERARPEHLEAARQRLERHGVVVLVLSRLVPAGRIPVMVACLLAGMPLRTFTRADVAAVLAWAAAYEAIGVLGGSLFARPWEGVALVVGVTLLISAVPPGWRWVRRGAHGG
ncbi:VTT domain-containing protein [Streptomyces sp. SL13]|uniref:VTT domain-containing protein n=1 Tax=Streptantibioticus silvisoli TaxID=2705255 RepID=A0AA90KFY0_9ACTN|nr:VTT domain-containing protein [Streptantibioticus silvisoli]MDI5967229.1 VTT domain-containing protein [Streptantibioticus silvisoli]MDI5969840.1 VTT domain-containing protein [Streptantibioticus silvisoli]